MKICLRCQAQVDLNLLICLKCGGRHFDVSGGIVSPHRLQPLPGKSVVNKRQVKVLRPFMQVALLPKKTVVMITAAVLFFLVLLFSGNNRLADLAAQMTKSEYERVMLEEVLATQEGVLLTSGLLPEDHPYASLVRSIGHDLLTALPDPVGFEYRFYVKDEDLVNAFAMPGGVIIVYRGLIEALKTPELLAAVVAHEISHVEQRHFLRQQYRSFGATALVRMIFGVTQDLGIINTVGLIGLKYSRDMELEADIEGARLLVKAGVSPQVFMDMLDILGQEDGGWSPAIISTHPSSDRRSRRIANMPEMRMSLPDANPNWSFRQ